MRKKNHDRIKTRSCSFTFYHNGISGLLTLSILLLLCQDIYGRAGGAGARSKSSSSSSSSSGSRSSGSSYSSKSSSSRSYSAPAGAAYASSNENVDDDVSTSPPTSLSAALIILGITLLVCSSILYAIIKIFRAIFGVKTIGRDLPTQIIGTMPDGLSGQKVKDAFIAIQDAWQQQDLRHVRRWISDGVYQRYTVQFAMMKKLSQINMLSNIKVKSIRPAKNAVDGNYQSADIEVSFAMDDAFISSKYPQFNEALAGEEATEYWTFIKRNDAAAGKDLYKNTNCPNCGAPFDDKMGEISRCAGCGTLTNNAAYDWVLSEITQEENYSTTDSISRDQKLRELTVHDSLFSIQRMEDMASNIFMQIMDVTSGGKDKKLERFADANTVGQILRTKQTMGTVIFDRIYVNRVSVVNYNLLYSRLNMVVQLVASYQRVIPAGNEIKKLDADMVSQTFTMVLSKNIEALQTPEKETVYSYECAGCGAPYTDTTDDSCTYCGQPVIDLNKSWVLTDFRMGG